MMGILLACILLFIFRWRLLVSHQTRLLAVHDSGLEIGRLVKGADWSLVLTRPHVAEEPEDVVANEHGKNSNANPGGDSQNKGQDDITHDVLEHRTPRAVLEEALLVL